MGGNPLEEDKENGVIPPLKTMKTLAVIMNKPKALDLSTLLLTPPAEGDVVVDVMWSGISTGTERLLFTGDMPHFPGMGYPLVPGYEAVGRVREAGKASGRAEGDVVFVPGARCYGDVHGLFGGAAQTIVVPGERATPVDDAMGSSATLLALAATARHALAAEGARLPDLIVGHGALGRLLARITVVLGGNPTVWETNETRSRGATGYQVVHPDHDDRKDYQAIYDMSGDSDILNSLIGRMAHGGEIVLAGFYSKPLSFAFPPAFMKETRMRVAAEWKKPDLDAVLAMVGDGRLSLDGLITHTHSADGARDAYATAFEDATCLKMILDWSKCQ